MFPLFNLSGGRRQQIHLNKNKFKTVSYILILQYDVGNIWFRLSSSVADPDPLVRVTNPDPDPSIIKQK
jgi:hypothetical protein